MSDLDVLVEENYVPQQGEKHDARYDSSNASVIRLAVNVRYRHAVADMRIRRLLCVLIAASVVLAR